MSALLNTHEAAEALDMSEYTVRKLARRVGVGYNIGGASGWRFTPAEVERMRDSMRPAAATPRRRRRRAS